MVHATYLSRGNALYMVTLIYNAFRTGDFIGGGKFLLVLQILRGRIFQGETEIRHHTGTGDE